MDEKYVATGSADRTAKVFDLKTGLCVRQAHPVLSFRTFAGHLLPVGCLQLGESKLVTGSADTTLKIWSLRDETCHFTLRYLVTPSYASNHHKRTITALKFVGQTLVSGSVDKSLKIWTLNERKLPGHASPMVKSTFKHPPVPIGGWTPAQLSRINLQQALVRKMEKTCDSIEKINPTCVRTLHGHQAAIKCLDFTPHVLISGDTLGFVKIWHVPSGNCLGTIDMNNIKPGPMQFEKVSGKISGMHNPLDKEAGSTKQEDEKSDPISFVSFKENRLAIGKFSGAMYFYAIYPYGICAQRIL